MAISKQEAAEALFQATQDRIDSQLKSRESLDEVTYCSVEGLPQEMIWRLQRMYEDAGWTVTYENCAGEYEDLWFR